jgi:putative PIN family toxin of toxin-antitoxin system
VRVFLDTKVLASSIATRGLCAELFESIINEHELLTCEPVLQELERVLADKFHLPESTIKAFIGLLKAEGSVITAQERPTIKFKDADDIPIIACAIASQADVFVTGDKDLLGLGAIKNIPILSPRQIWQKLAGVEDESKSR